MGVCPAQPKPLGAAPPTEDKSRMDRRTLMLSAGALVAAAAAGARAQPARDALAALADPGRKASVLGVAMIARDRGGQVVLAEAHGRGVQGEGAARRERPLTLDTPARVASISKLVATAGLMTLLRDGYGMKMDASDPLDFVLRHPLEPNRPITLERLASHTSGLRNAADFPVPAGRRLEDALLPGRPNYDGGDWWSKPGVPTDSFAYSDANFAVLAQVIEGLSGERFDRYMTHHLFRPLGLDAGYNWSGVSQAKRDLATACCRPKQGVWTAEVDAVVPPAPAARIFAAPERPGLTSADIRPRENGFALAPQGGLRASVRDLDRLAVTFRDAARGRRGLPLDTRDLSAMAYQPEWRFNGTNGETEGGLYLAYGLGVQIPTGVPGPQGDAFFGADSSHWRGHFGEAYGLVSGMFWNTRDRRTLSWMINGTPGEATETPGRRSALSPWEEAAIDAGLAAQAPRRRNR